MWNVRYVLHPAEVMRHHGGVSLELRIALERLVHLRRIRAHVEAAFGEGKPSDRLHNRELTKHVAAAIDAEPSSMLGRDVQQAMRAAGWRPVRHARCIWWKGKRRL